MEPAHPLLLRPEVGAGAPPTLLSPEGHVTRYLSPKAELKCSRLAIIPEGDRLSVSRSQIANYRDWLFVSPIVCLKDLASGLPKEEISSRDAAQLGKQA